MFTRTATINLYADYLDGLPLLGGLDAYILYRVSTIPKVVLIVSLRNKTRANLDTLTRVANLFCRVDLFRPR